MLSLSIACIVDADIAQFVTSGGAQSIRVQCDRSVIRELRKIYRTVNIVSAVEGSNRTMEEITRLRPDVVFNLAFSTLPSEVSFAGCLSICGVPFTGSASKAIALSNDKVLSRMILRNAGVPVPNHVALPARQHGAASLRPPLIVKPVSLGGSAGIYVDSVLNSIHGVNRLVRRIEQKFGVAAMCEEFIVGRDIRVGLVESKQGNFRISGLDEWQFPTERKGYGFKFQAIRSSAKLRRLRRIIHSTPTLSRRQKIDLIELAQVCVRSLGIRGYATIDLRLDETQTFQVLEVNSNPGLYSESPLWRIPDFESNIRRIVNAAFLPDA